MQKKLFVLIGAVLGLVVLFQNCSPISVNKLSLTSVTPVSCDPSVYNIAREAQTINGKTVYFLTQNNQDMSHEYRGEIRWFVNNVEQPGLMVAENRLQLDCNTHPEVATIAARFVTDCDEEIEIQETFNKPTTCEEEPPEPPTCEEDPTQPHCNNQPNDCSDLPAPFFSRDLREYSAPFISNELHNENGFGVPFGSSIAFWKNLGSANKYSQDGTLIGIGVKSLRFVAPANMSGEVMQFVQSTTSGVAVSVSSQCGSFDVPLPCLLIASSTASLTTNQAANPNAKCILVPGQTYFYNIAYFNLPIYRTTGEVRSTCGTNNVNYSCQGNSCISACAGGHKATGYQ